ncbi:uncharacterized protein LOC142564355 isoform X2 [Dermacentor variabilis]|uniref:uncharacterized protein LOC142564355 isoform X2 n=1 Tax=Dermacentor variabilis TaxID=34621 RepID=UPI003F5C7317
MDILFSTAVKSAECQCYRKIPGGPMTAIRQYAFFFLCVFKCCEGIVVYPKLLESRADGGPLILQVQPGLTLNLEKSSILAKDLVFVSSSSHISTINGEALERNLYHDTMLKSSLIVDQLNGAVQARGILNPNLRIAPLVESRSSNGYIPHEVIENGEKSTSMSGENENEDTGISSTLYCTNKVCGGAIF